MRISFKSESIKRFKTALPNDPVPPVIKRTIPPENYLYDVLGFS